MLGRAEKDSEVARHARSPCANRRPIATKALRLLGATMDDIMVDKALRVMGEAPGHEVPAGALPRAPDVPTEPLEAPHWDRRRSKVERVLGEEAGECMRVDVVRSVEQDGDLEAGYG